MDQRICNKCKTECKISAFRKYSNGGYSSVCKKCLNEMDKLRKKELRKKRLETTYFQCNICKTSKKLKEFAKLKVNYKKKICLECYPDFVKTSKNEWCKNQHNTNPSYRIKKSLAARLRTVMKKDTHTMNYIGCNIQYLREWFEYNFKSGMNWDNYGTYWSIDHVIPVSTFDLTKEDEKYRCWNWSNMVPMTVSSNSSKRNNIDPQQITNIKEKLLKFKEEGSTTKWFSDEFMLTNSINHLKI
jgi:hypothetical protein